MATSGFNAVVSTFKDYIHSPTAKFDLNIEIYNAAAAQVTSKSEWAGQFGQSEAQKYDLYFKFKFLQNQK